MANAPLQISISEVDLPHLREGKAGLSAATASPAQGRSLDSAAPQGVAELLAVAAQVAWAQFQSKGLALVTSKLRKFVCDDLRLDQPMLVPLGLATAAAPASEQQLLPNTCKAINNLNAQDLINSIKATVYAMLEDLAYFGLRVASSKLSHVVKIDALSTVLTAAATMIVDSAAGRSQLTARDGQLVLSRLAQVDWKTVVPAAYPTLACGLDVAFAIVGSCHSQGGCDARAIAKRISDPSQFFDATDVGCYNAAVKSAWPDLDQFIARALNVVEPPKGSTPQSIAKSSVSLVFDIASRALCGGPIAACDPAIKIGTDMRALEDGRRLALAAIEADIASVVIATADLVNLALEPLKDDSHGKVKTAITKGSALLTAISAYAATYANDAKSDYAAAHDARKKALESLIAATTDRSGRDGEVVVSLGVAVGLGGGLDGEFATKMNSLGGVPPQLTLPLGVAVQVLPTNRYHFGFHFQFSAIDLAQFISYKADGSVNPPRWDSFLMVGTEFGFLVGSPNATFVIGTDLRYAPTLFTPGGQSPAGGTLRWMCLLLTYYVPFFDFN